MTIGDAYSRWAETYDLDRNLTRDLDRSTTLELLGSHRFHLTIEAGCGTGKNTTLLTRISASVLGLDFSSGMLRQAVQRVPAPNVHFCQADLLRSWPCRDGIAGLVTCNLVLEHVEHIEPLFREATRVLAAGGTCYVSELHPFRQYGGGQAHFVDRSGTPIRIQAYTHHISDFTRAASAAGLALERLDQWWHAEDVGKPPRLLTLVLTKKGSPRPATAPA